MDATVVWLSPDPASTPSESRRAVEEWARARGMNLVLPAGGQSVALSVDYSAGDRVEAELERARDAVAANDADAATQSLARAEALLREHPALPHAAWLMAEVLRARASRWTRLEPRDRDAAARAWRDAAALDGGRMPGVGEEERTSELTAVEGGLEVDRGESLVVRFDGAPVATGRMRAAAAEHHVVVLRDGAPVWARWITWPPPNGALKIAVPAPTACSSDELALARLEGEGVRGTGIDCPRWVAAVTTDRPDVIRVALCDASTCGPLLEWRAHAWTDTPPVTPRRAEPGGFPAWGWALAGVGAMAITGIVLASAGAFDQPAAAEVRWVNGGVRVESR